MSEHVPCFCRLADGYVCPTCIFVNRMMDERDSARSALASAEALKDKAFRERDAYLAKWAQEKIAGDEVRASLEAATIEERVASAYLERDRLRRENAVMREALEYIQSSGAMIDHWYGDVAREALAAVGTKEKS